MVAAGSVDSFDRGAYKVSLATTLDGVSPYDIELEVSAASIRVTTTVRTASAAAADAALSTLTTIASSPAALSTALGVTVEEVVAMPATVVSESSVQAEAIPVGSDDLETNDSDSGGSMGAIIGAAVGSVVILGLLGFRVWYHFKEKGAPTTAFTTSSTDVEVHEISMTIHPTLGDSSAAVAHAVPNIAPSAAVKQSVTQDR